MSKGKYLAIDYGDKRVGLAISDFDKLIAFPRETITFKSKSGLIRKISELCSSESVSKIILGLPIEMDGSFGDRFVKTQKFGDLLKEELSNISVEYFDERLTTKQATKKLHQQGFAEKHQKGQKDMISAQIILEAYLSQMES